jgi:hypothetical protein
VISTQHWIGSPSDTASPTTVVSTSTAVGSGAGWNSISSTTWSGSTATPVTVVSSNPEGDAVISYVLGTTSSIVTAPASSGVTVPRTCPPPSVNMVSAATGSPPLVTVALTEPVLSVIVNEPVRESSNPARWPVASSLSCTPTLCRPETRGFATPEIRI